MNTRLKELPQSIIEDFLTYCKRRMQPSVYKLLAGRTFTADGKSIGNLLTLVDMLSKHKSTPETRAIFLKLLQFTEGKTFKPVSTRQMSKFSESKRSEQPTSSTKPKATPRRSGRR